MISLITRISLIVLGVYTASEIFKSKAGVLKYSPSSNCSNLLIKFDKSLQIGKRKKDILRVYKNKLSEKIREYFKGVPEYTYKGLWIQGSYKMDTMIKTKDNECDIDVGLYFTRVPEGISPNTVRNHVYRALNSSTTKTPQDWSKVIRLQYKDFHIDFPVYYFDDTIMDTPLLATKNEGWTENDPKELYDLFNNYEYFKKKDCKQVKRIIRLLKAIGDNYKKKALHGLAFSLFVIENYEPHERDDIALINVLISIQDHLKSKGWKLKMPVAPYDNVLRKYKSNQRENFENYLDDMIMDLREALKMNKQEAANIWKIYLGRNFQTV